MVVVLGDVEECALPVAQIVVAVTVVVVVRVVALVVVAVLALIQVQVDGNLWGKFSKV